MILLQDDILIELGDIIFRTKKFINPQFQLDPDALQGFYDGVNAKRQDTVRPNQWGDFSEPTLLGSRHMTISGIATANSPTQLHEMRDQFTSVLINGQYSPMSVTNASGTRYVYVTFDGSPSWVQKIDTAALFKLDLYAPDPRMYGPEKSLKITDGTVGGGIDYPIDYPLDFGGPIQSVAVTITNNGNTDSWPVFKITGDFFSGFTITDGLNKSVTYEGIVTTQAPVTIDMGAGTAMQSGTDKSTLLSRREWFSIPPKGAIAPRFIPTQDSFGWCDIIYRDTWI